MAIHLVRLTVLGFNWIRRSLHKGMKCVLPGKNEPCWIRSKRFSCFPPELSTQATHLEFSIIFPPYGRRDSSRPCQPMILSMLAAPWGAIFQELQMPVGEYALVAEWRRNEPPSSHESGQNEGVRGLNNVPSTKFSAKQDR